MEKSLLFAKVKDAVSIADKTSAPHFIGFLTAEEKAELFKEFSHLNVSFYGGYEDAERCFLAALPLWCEKDNFSVFPITSITLFYKEEYHLTHRDFLGTLMSLGIKRECVGDILVGKGKTVVFLSRDIAEFVKLNLLKVGGVGVTFKEGIDGDLPGHSTLCDFSDTVASLRLDCVVSALAKVSRNAAVQMIESSLVSVNSLLCEKITKTVCENDKITLRGKGKFIIGNVSAQSKKGRIILNYKKYV